MADNAPLESLPRIKRTKSRSAVKSAASNAAVAGLGALFSAASRAVDRMPLDKTGLLTFLHVRLHTADKARDRARWFGGRLYNRLSGEEPDYVPLSGTHARQALSLVGIDVGDALDPASLYLVRYDLVDAARAILKQEFQPG